MTIILVLSVIGIVAILLELVLPGGILGILGGMALIAAAIKVFVGYGATAGAIYTVGSVAIIVVVFLLWMKYFDRLPFAKNLILRDAVSGEDGTGQKSVGTDPNLLGKRGITLTDLLPSGRARIEGQRHDVVAESGAIDKDTEIEVVALNPIPVVRSVE